MPNKLAEVKIALTVREGDDVVVDLDFEGTRFSSSVLKQETISINASTFQALTIPTGAKLLVIDVGTAISLTAKGVTGDTGVKIAPTSNPLGIPAILPLGTSPQIGILNGDTNAVSINLIWC